MRNKKKSLSLIAGILFIICIPTLLISTNLRLAANSARLYEYGFDKYEVSAAVGLDESELRDFAREMIAYFNSDEEFMDTDLFSQRELAHLNDVKGLIRQALYFQISSGALIAIYLIFNFVRRKSVFRGELPKQVIWGGIVTVVFLVVLGLWAVTDFNSLFLLFHVLSFRNELWQLNQGDTMLLMFPQGFFNDAALFVGAATIGEAVIFGGIAWGFIVRRRKSASRATAVDLNRDNESVVDD